MSGNAKWIDALSAMGAAALLLAIVLSTTALARAGDGIEANGWLRVEGGKLVNRDGKPIQLRGMSSHGLQWHPEYVNAGAMRYIRECGGSLFRAAMYADSADGGYNESPEHARRNKAIMGIAIENALAADLYIIVDWHLLEDENPLLHMENAVEFFEDISERYRDQPGILYEICNEPNGDASWEDIRRYAERVIPVIRKHSPGAVVIVGTPRYSSDIQAPLRSPFSFENVMYSYHFYTGHTDKERTDTLREAVDAGLPVFVTEWGIDAGDDEEGAKRSLETARWFIRYLADNGISWANWSLCNKDESYSAIRPDVRKLSGWSEDDLSISGKLVFGALRRTPDGEKR